MISDGDNLPNPSRVVRYAGFAKMFKGEDDNVIRPSVNAFTPKADEAYLSVTWCEYFSGQSDEQLRCAIEAIRASRTVGPKACFCLANTADIKATAAEFGIETREIYHPEDDNPAHAGIYSISVDEKQLLERLADDTWSQFLKVQDADALPVTECPKSDEVA